MLSLPEDLAYAYVTGPIGDTFVRVLPESVDRAIGLRALASRQSRRPAVAGGRSYSRLAGWCMDKLSVSRVGLRVVWRGAEPELRSPVATVLGEASTYCVLDQVLEGGFGRVLLLQDGPSKLASGAFLRLWDQSASLVCAFNPDAQWYAAASTVEPSEGAPTVPLSIESGSAGGLSLLEDAHLAVLVVPAEFSREDLSSQLASQGLLRL